MKIEVFLSELLYEHDCVVIPQFGGLVANYRHAKLNELNHTIYPPSKQLAFNRNLLQNDGLLYKHVSDMLGLGYTEAKNEVDEAIKSLKNKLLKGEKVVLERIGVFFPDRKGIVQFIPADQENYLLQSYGLPSIQLVPVAKPIEVTEVSGAQEDDKKIIVMEPQKRSELRWKIAAAIAVPLLLAGGWLAGESIFGHQRGNESLKLFNWKDVKTVYEPRKEEVDFTKKDELLSENNSADPLDVEETSPELSSLDESTKPTVAAIDSTHVEVAHPDIKMVSNYHLIAGAFQVKSNAENLISQLKAQGLYADFAGMRGDLHLVSVGSFSTKVEANEAKQAIKNQSAIKCWILERK
jgi:hypothetical protein